MRVLVADDDLVIRRLLENTLRQWGHDVALASDGQQAFDALADGAGPPLALIDWMMPGMDGYAAIHEIRGRSAFRRLPIIALTAKAMKGDRDKCLEAGASDYLAKPVNTEQLLSTLRTWLHR